MTATVVIALLIFVSCVFLIVFGERVGDWLDRRAERPAPAPEEGDVEFQYYLDERAGFGRRIAAERNPGRRAAWRMLRDREQGDDQ